MVKGGSKMRRFFLPLFLFGALTLLAAAGCDKVDSKGGGGQGCDRFAQQVL